MNEKPGLKDLEIRKDSPEYQPLAVDLVFVVDAPSLRWPMPERVKPMMMALPGTARRSVKHRRMKRRRNTCCS